MDVRGFIRKGTGEGGSRNPFSLRFGGYRGILPSEIKCPEAGVKNTSTFTHTGKYFFSPILTYVSLIIASLQNIKKLCI